MPIFTRHYKKYPSREIDDFDVILFQIYQGIDEPIRFGKVIAKIKWCSVFA